jgi:hypothetical protein
VLNVITGADGLAVARDPVQHARREDLAGEPREHQRRERRLLRGLQNDGVAGRQRRPDLPDGHHQRVVPGRDLPDDADGLAPDHRRVAAHVLARGLPLEQARGAGEEAQVVGRDRDLVVDDRLWLADVRRLEGPQLVRVLVQGVGQPEQRLGALLRRRLAPLRKRLLRRLDGAVDIGLASARNLADHLARGGVDHLLCPALDGVDPLAADVVPPLLHGRAHALPPSVPFAPPAPA